MTTKDVQVQVSSSIPTAMEMNTCLLFALIADSASRRIDMEAIDMDPRKIRPYPGNPRVNEKTIEPLMQSIRDYGFNQPIVVDEELVVLAGHARLTAALKLGLDHVPVVIASGLTEEQARAYRLADNKTNDLAVWDLDLLNSEVKDIGGALSGYGIEVESVQSYGSPEKTEHVANHVCPRCKHEF